jgi:RNA polymerase sigma factor (sigma-70 family)
MPACVAELIEWLRGRRQTMHGELNRHDTPARQRPDAQDMDLVREFVRDNSDAAFAELVRRHLNLVYSVARRCTDNDEDARDVAQAVFIILAQKAAGLSPKTLLPGWLYETTRFTAARLLRTNARRHAREQEAYMQSILNETGRDSIWEELSPHLETAMSRLAERDRALLVLRFYQNKSGPEAAALLGVCENTLHKRVARALEKLRLLFAKQGVTLSGEALAGAISANSVQAVPVGLAEKISTIALAKGAAASISAPTLMKGALKIMAWTKAKTAATVGVGALLVIGIGTATTALIVQHQYRVEMQTSFPRSLWTNAGYADPAAALETIFWAQTQGDGKMYLGSMTSDLQQKLQEQFAGQLSKQGISLEGFLAQKSKQHISPVTGFYISGQQSVSNQLLLRVWIPGKGQNATFKMKKVGNEWKLDEEFLPDY